MKVTDEPVIVTQLFKCSKERLWKAITEYDKMLKWFFEEIPDFKAEVDFITSFNVKAPSQDFYHLWEIIEVIPFKKIVYNWKYKDFKGDSNVTFNLLEKGHSTLLILTTEILEDFNDSIPEFTRDSCENGWKYFVQERLVSYLNSNND
ncbi:MAG: SRPBCC domain-containing protein [Flavobacteriaceae bacterium]|nr:SRPBCC domain-containing protein [Flavobacteriaceae bacterium]